MLAYVLGIGLHSLIFSLISGFMCNACVPRTHTDSIHSYRSVLLIISKAHLKLPRSSLSATSGLEVEKPATGSVRSPYWASLTSCPVPRGSPPLPQAAWAWPEAARAESGCEGRRRVGQQDAASRRTCWRSDHPGQEEMPGPSPSPPPSSPPLAAAASRHTTHTMTSQLERIPLCGRPTESSYLTSEQEGRKSSVVC